MEKTPATNKIIADLVTICGLVDAGRETLDSDIREAALPAKLKEDVKNGAEDLRKAYTRLREISDALDQIPAGLLARADASKWFLI